MEKYINFLGILAYTVETLSVFKTEIFQHEKKLSLPIRKIDFKEL